MGRSTMIDEKTLELIKNNRYSEGTNFTEELRSLIHRFYEDFDLDKQDEDYREAYIRDFVKQHEEFLVNYQTNVFNANINTNDNLSDQLTLNKFMSTLATYLTKYREEVE